MTDDTVPDEIRDAAEAAQRRLDVAQENLAVAQRLQAVAQARLTAWQDGYAAGLSMGEHVSTTEVVVTEAVAPARRLIETEDALDALPYEAVVREGAGAPVGDVYVWEHRGNRRWVPASDSAVFRSKPRLPVIVLFDPSTEKKDAAHE